MVVTSFDESFVPDDIVSREKETKKITEILRPAKSGDFSVLAYVHGESGTGKTVTVKSILKKQFMKKSVYVNCFRDRTNHNILEEVLLQSGFFVHGRYSVKDMEKRLESSGKKFIICLDECEKIKDARIIESFVRCGFGVMLISERLLSESKLTKKVRTHVSLEEVAFDSYSQDEIAKILQDRLDNEVNDNPINHDVLLQISQNCNSNANTAIQMTREIARDSGRLTSAENMQKVIQKVKRQSIDQSLHKLNESQKMILQILHDHKILPSGKLFRIYQSRSKYDKNDRSYRNHMMRIKEMGLVKEIGSTKGRAYEIIT